MSTVRDLAMRLRCAVIASSILLAGIALAAPVTPAAQAALDGCRSDPIITLSDGSIIDVTADIGTSVSNVTGIAYTLHVPHGLKMILYVATPTLGFKGKESFTLVNDAPAGQYQTDTLVQTGNSSVSVTSHTSLVGLYLTSLSLSLQSKPAFGFSGNHVWSTIYR